MGKKSEMQVIEPDLRRYEALVELLKTGETLEGKTEAARTLVGRYSTRHPQLPLLGTLLATAIRESERRSELVTAAATLGADEAEALPLDPLIARLSAGVDEEVRGFVQVPSEVAEKLGISAGRRTCEELTADLLRLVGAPLLQTWAGDLPRACRAGDTWTRLGEVFETRRHSRSHLVPAASRSVFLAGTRQALSTLGTMEKEIEFLWSAGAGGDMADIEALADGVRSMVARLADPNDHCRLGWAVVGRQLALESQQMAWRRGLARGGAELVERLGRQSPRSRRAEWLRAVAELNAGLAAWRLALAALLESLDQLRSALAAACKGLEVPETVSRVPGLRPLDAPLCAEGWRGALVTDPVRLVTEALERALEGLERAVGRRMPNLPIEGGDWGNWFATTTDILIATLKDCGLVDAQGHVLAALSRVKQDLEEWVMRRELSPGVVVLLDEEAPWGELVSQVGQDEPAMAGELRTIGEAIDRPGGLDELSLDLGRAQANHRKLAYLLARHPSARRRIAELTLAACRDQGLAAEQTWWLDVFGADAPQWRALVRWVTAVRKAVRSQAVLDATGSLDNLRDGVLHDARRALDGFAIDRAALRDFPDEHRREVQSVVAALEADRLRCLSEVDSRLAIQTALFGALRSRKAPRPVWRESMEAWPAHLDAPLRLAGEVADTFYELCLSLQDEVLKQPDRAERSLLRNKQTYHLSPTRLAARADAGEGLPTASRVQVAARDLIQALAGCLAGGGRISPSGLTLIRAVGRQLNSIHLPLLQLGLPHHEEAAEELLTIDFLRNLEGSFSSRDGLILDDIPRVLTKLEDARWVCQLFTRYASTPVREAAAAVVGTSRVEEATELLRQADACRLAAGRGVRVGDVAWMCRQLPLPSGVPVASLSAYLATTVRRLHRPLIEHSERAATLQLRERVLRSTAADLQEPREILRLLLEIDPHESSTRELLRFLE